MSMIKDSIQTIQHYQLLTKISILLLSLLIMLGLIYQDPLYPLAFLILPIVYLAVFRIDLLFYLTVITITFSVNLDITPSLTVDAPDEPLMWLFIPICILLLLTKPGILPDSFWKNQMVGISAIILIWIVVTIVPSTNVAFSLKFLIAKLWMVMTFFIVAFIMFKSYHRMRITFMSFLIALSIVVSFFMYRHSLIGFDFENVNDAILPFYHNHVNYSATLSMMIPMVIVSVFLAKKKWQKICLSFILILFFIALYFSYGRGAWMATILAAATYVIVRLRLMKIAVLLTFAFILFSFYYVAKDYRFLNYRPNYDKTLMHDNLADHIAATFRGRDVSSMERVYRWIAAVRMAPLNPVFGVGPNNFYENYRGSAVSIFKTWVSRNLERSTSHNYFLLMLTEQGFPGMILYGIFVFMAMAYGQKIYHQTSQRTLKLIAMGLTCLLAAFFLNNFLSELIESDEMGSLMYMAIAALVAIDLHNRKNIDISPDLP